jgi:exonuclease V gamma subunit
MILLITPSSRAQECAAMIQKATGEATECVESVRRASKLLRNGEYAALVIDQYLAECDPDSTEVLLQHAGTAVPVYMNLAISGGERVVRELKQALRRSQRERQVARREAELALRNELKDNLTALLLSCELALAVPQLPATAEAKVRSACDLAKDIRSRLGLEEKASVAGGGGGAKS